MPRDKLTTLFDKNHIKITKEVLFCGKNKELGVHLKEFGYPNGVSIAPPHKTVKVKLKSPLGFYYWKWETLTPKEPTKWLTELTIKTRKEIYILNFTTTFGNQRVNFELRPWYLYPEDKSFSDNFVDSLYKEVLKLLDIIKEFNLDIICGVDRKISLRELKEDLFLKLFGNKNGPRFQSDIEKLESHGFDRKESFRKRKEEI